MSGAKVRKGDKIRARVHHDGVKSGTEGKVIGAYSGVYYAINYPSVPGVCYSPDPQIEAVTGPATAPGAEPGNSSPTLSAAQDHIQRVGVWERLMSMVGVGS
jgi:hypothetical protein